MASIASILATVVLLRFWQPKDAWRFDSDPPVEEELAARRRPDPGTGRLSPGPGAAARSELPASSDRREAFMAWLPWILLAVLVFLWGTPQVKSFLNDLSTTLHLGTKINWPGLHLEVVRTPPVVAKDTAEKAVYEFFPLSATGTALLLTGILSGLILRLRPGEIGRGVPRHAAPGALLAADQSISVPWFCENLEAGSVCRSYGLVMRFLEPGLPMAVAPMPGGRTGAWPPARRKVAPRLSPAITHLPRGPDPAGGPRRQRSGDHT